MDHEYNVVINFYRNGEGWLDREELIDTIYCKTSAEAYANGMDEDDIQQYLSGVDGIKISILNENGVEIDEYWIDE